MSFHHPDFHDISLIQAAIQSNEEEEHERSRRAKPMPSEELPSGSGSSAFAAFVVCAVISCILLAFIFS